jgi:hypothetical protein
MKNNKLLILSSMLAISASSFANAQFLAWDDDFSGASLNSNLTVSNAGPNASVSQTSGQLILNTGTTTGAAFATAYTSTSAAGESTFNGNSLYDFYKHSVAMSFDIASFAGAPDTGRNRFMFGIGQSGTAGGRYNTEAGTGANTLGYGVGFTLEKFIGGTGSRLVVSTSNNGVVSNQLFNITGGEIPTSVSVLLGGTSATVTMTGATFVISSSNSVTVTLADLSKIEAFTDYDFFFGAHNLGVVTAQTIVTLDSFSVTAIPEPASVGFLLGMVALMGVVRTRRSR